MGKLWKYIERMGFGHGDVKTIFRLLILMFRILALNIDSRDKKGISLYLYIISGMSMGVSAYVYIWSVAWTAWRCFITGDKVTAMITVSIALCNAIGSAKLAFLFIHRKTVIKIIDGYLISDENVIPNSRMYFNQLKNLRRVIIRAIIAWTWIMVNMFMYVTKPLVMPGRQKIDTTIIYGLEPMSESPNYEIAYMMGLVSCLFVNYVSATVCALVVIFSGCSEAQILALSSELYCLWDDVQQEVRDQMNLLKEERNKERDEIGEAALNLNENENFAVRNKLKQKINRYIYIHAMYIEQQNLVEGVLREALALEVGFVLIALIAELLGGLQNTYPLLSYTFVIISFDCFTGQRLSDASVALEVAVYECKWENFDVSNMKTVLLMLKGSQKTLALSAGGIHLFNFVLLMTVVRFTYSTYTALKSTYYEEN